MLDVPPVLDLAPVLDLPPPAVDDFPPVELAPPDELLPPIPELSSAALLAVADLPPVAVAEPPVPEASRPELELPILVLLPPAFAEPPTGVSSGDTVGSELLQAGNARTTVRKKKGLRQIVIMTASTLSNSRTRNTNAKPQYQELTSGNRQRQAQGVSERVLRSRDCRCSASGPAFPSRRSLRHAIASWNIPALTFSVARHPNTHPLALRWSKLLRIKETMSSKRGATWSPCCACQMTGGLRAGERSAGAWDKRPTPKRWA